MRSRRNTGSRAAIKENLTRPHPWNTSDLTVRASRKAVCTTCCWMKGQTQWSVRFLSLVYLLHLMLRSSAISLPPLAGVTLLEPAGQTEWAKVATRKKIPQERTKRWNRRRYFFLEMVRSDVMRLGRQKAHMAPRTLSRFLWLKLRGKCKRLNENLQWRLHIHQYVVEQTFLTVRYPKSIGLGF